MKYGELVIHIARIQTFRTFRLQLFVQAKEKRQTNFEQHSNAIQKKNGNISIRIRFYIKMMNCHSSMESDGNPLILN